MSFKDETTMILDFLATGCLALGGCLPLGELGLFVSIFHILIYLYIHKIKKINIASLRFFVVLEYWICMHGMFKKEKFGRWLIFLYNFDGFFFARVDLNLKLRKKIQCN